MTEHDQPRYELGMVLGKFMPPHHGHRVVIQAALQQSRRVCLVIAGQSQDRIPVQQRYEWLRAIYPTADVRVLDVTFPVTDERAWADGVLQACGEVPSVVFSSEGYGQRLAELLDCTHILVDPDRRQVPVSATRIWEDPRAYSQFLEPMVVDWLISRLDGHSKIG